MRATFLLSVLSLVPACAGLTSSKDEGKAASYLENAWSYFVGKDYARSIDQIERGLAHDPDHYLLNQLKGRVYLESARIANPDLFRRSLVQFEKVRDLRGDSQHDYLTWLGLGEAHQGLYKQHRKERKRLEREAKQPGLEAAKAGEMLARAREHNNLYKQHMRSAEQFYLRVVETKDLGVMPARERLFILEMDRAVDLEGDVRTAQLRKAVEQAGLYLQENAFRQTWYGKMLEITGDLEQEQRARRLLRDLRRREKSFRASFANLLYELDDFTKARAQLDKVLELDPTSAADYYNRARCLVKLDEKQLAVRDLESFLRITRQSFDAPQVKEATALLDKLGKG